MSIADVGEMTREEFIEKWTSDERDPFNDKEEFRKDLDALIAVERNKEFDRCAEESSKIAKKYECTISEMKKDFSEMKKDFDELMGLANVMFAESYGLNEQDDCGCAGCEFQKWKSKRAGKGK